MQRQPQVLVIAQPDCPDLQDMSSCLHSIRYEQVSCIEFSGDRALKRCPELLILVGLPEPSQALELLRRLSDRGVQGSTLAILPRDADSSDIGFASARADDFVLWPEPLEAVRQRILRLITPGLDGEAEEAYENLIRELGKANLVGRDPVFRHIAERLADCARATFPILITGETGTGKEMCARAVHFLSDRRNQPFIPVDCASLPDHLFENELFGHARGAYTDAHGEQRGLAALADGGTLFLDEIDSLSLTAQSKLLRFLQEHQFKPLGFERFVRANVRITAASNRNLEQLTAEKRFRLDLYYRLDVLHLVLPPLRERRGEVVLLANHFLQSHLPAGVRKSFSQAALNRLTGYAWPGNVRELLNVVQRAIAFARGAQISASDISLPARSSTNVDGDFRGAKQATIEAFEREYVQELLRKHAGNITHAAQEAGKERRAFGRLAKKYGLAESARAAGQN
jgi:DNA-binding NtrC family response regulator